MTLEDWVVDELTDAEDEAKESHKAAMNSYGAGHDAGYVAALKIVLSKLGPTAAGDEVLEN